MLPSLSVVMPVMNEAGQIRRAVDRLRRQDPAQAVQIVVVDGDPRGTTICMLEKQAGVLCLTSRPGRARQMNRGAAAAAGRIVCFLHCDTVLPDGAFARIQKVMADRRVAAGAFDLSIDAPDRVFRMIEKSASLRSRLTRIPYGDQAVFLRSSYFHRLGGFADIPLMEDVELMQRIKKQRGEIRIIPRPVRTSARRWQKEGWMVTMMRNWALRLLYTCGVPPRTLARIYPDH